MFCSGEILRVCIIHTLNITKLCILAGGPESINEESIKYVAPTRYGIWMVMRSFGHGVSTFMGALMDIRASESTFNAVITNELILYCTYSLNTVSGDMDGQVEVVQTSELKITKSRSLW